MSPGWRALSGGIDTTMSAKSSPRPLDPPNMTPGGSNDGRARRRHEEIDLAGVGRARPDDEGAVRPAGAAGCDGRQSDAHKSADARSARRFPWRRMQARPGAQPQPHDTARCFQPFISRPEKARPAMRIRSAPADRTCPFSPAPPRGCWVMNHQIAISTTMTMRMIAHIGKPFSRWRPPFAARSWRRSSRSSSPQSRRSKRLMWPYESAAAAAPPRPASSPEAPSALDTSGGSAAESRPSDW